MAAQGLIRAVDGAEGPLKAVLPLADEQHEIHCLESIEEAQTVLLCLTLQALGTAPTFAEVLEPSSNGSLAQLTRELQACVLLAHPDEIALAELPPLDALVLAAASLGHVNAAQQLLLIDPRAASVEVGWPSDSAAHRAALHGHAAMLRLLLAAAPAAATITRDYEFDHILHQNWSLMHSAASGGSAEVIEAVLTAAPQLATASTSQGTLPLFVACFERRAAAVQKLLAVAPSAAAARDAFDWYPLHAAAVHNLVEAVQLLLAAGAHGIDCVTRYGDTPLHLAAISDETGSTVRLLLAAAPHTALLQESDGFRPLQLALQHDQLSAARALLAASGLTVEQLLEELGDAGPGAQPLYADLVAWLPLSATQWQQVPTPCPGLGRALPTVLARSDIEAGHLVEHLPPGDRQRLRAGAACLQQAQQRLGVFLPEPIPRRIMCLVLLD